MTQRTLLQLIPGRATSDGAGVKLRRSIGQASAGRTDPFLMLDEFGTDNPDDYIAGFPPHPHRGFETVTIMLDGRMRHQDHLGNVGELGGGGVQWMSAGRGIIHSEMPMQDKGRMRGFQLWINLPAAEKMKPASYRDIPAEQVPTVALAAGGSARVIAGSLPAALSADGREVAGPIQGLSTDPLVLDLRLDAGARLELPVAATYTATPYVYEGEVLFGDALAGGQANAGQSNVGQAGVVPAGNAALLSPGDALTITAGPAGASVLLLVARPIGEPIVQYGPFVMNTRAEIEQAIADFQSGRLASVAAERR
jgi:redox-sensitive bicupin YhaK (pirin superfamily)